MTAFDAHLRPRSGDDSAWRRAAALIGGRPGVLVASIAAAATIVCVAFLALAAGQEVRFHAARAVDGLQASVFMRPQTSRAAAEALKAQLDALPFVRSAALRTKEAAIVALETSGLPTGNRPNPLPDVWIVTLAFGDPDAAASLTGRVATARRALAGLPDVESVDVDAEWLATLERWQALSATGFRVGLVALFAIVWVVLGCVYFLAGRGLASPSDRSDRAPGWAAILVGALVALATLLTSIAVLAAVTFGVDSAGFDWKPIAVRVGQMSVPYLVALAASVVGLSIALIGASTRRR